MSSDAWRRAINGRCQENWTATPIEFDEHPASDDLEAAKRNGTPYLRITSIFGDGAQITLGPTAIVRVQGRIVGTIFVPHRTTLTTLDQLVDAFCPIFERQRFAGILCRARQLSAIAPDKAWAGINVAFPFYANEQTTVEP